MCTPPPPLPALPFVYLLSNICLFIVISVYLHLYIYNLSICPWSSMICLSVCLSIFIVLFIYLNMPVCLYHDVYLHISAIWMPIYIFTVLYIYIYLSVCVSVCLSLCLYVCLSVCLYVCIYMYVCMYVCLYECRYVCMAGDLTFCSGNNYSCHDISDNK